MMKEILKKIRMGDGLNDKELKLALSFFKTLTDNLDSLGSEFFLAAKESRYILIQLKEVEFFRKAKPYKDYF